MKIICIGRNYAEHIAELKNEVPQDMVIFLKPATALHKLQDDWYIPEFSDDIHYECEVVLKVCKNGKHIQPQFASNYFQEISLGIDFTARDIQTTLKDKGLPWERAKAFDHSAVVGRFIDKSSIDIRAIQFQLTKNNEIVQRGDTRQMLYNFETIIVEISKYFTLQVGDLIYTGTPAGVGKVTSQDFLTGLLEQQEVFRLQIR